MEYSAEEILRQLRIDDDVLNIYPYGSHVYGNATDNSDNDYVIVAKSAFLSNGSFKNNAISNKDFSIQGILYSRTGFIDALNNYDITALECIFLPDELVIQKKWAFKLSKDTHNDLAKKLISKSSMSMYAAKNHKKRDNIELAKRGVFHAIRILEFGIQIKEHGRIVNYSSCNQLKAEIMGTKDFHTSTYDPTLRQLEDRLKSK